MSKIYDALEHAQFERKRLEKNPLAPIHKETTSKNSELEMEEIMIQLYQNICSCFPDNKGKTIQFIGSRKGEGTSTLIREFSRATASIFDASVLLLDANNHHACQSSFFDIRPGCGWKEVIKDGKPIRDVLYQVGNSRMYISQVSLNQNSMASIVDSPRISDLFEELKKDFKFIVIDSPSATISNDGLALCNKVDGIILVVEAESTRWQVAHAVKEKIVKRGGNILGIILNKRRFYIPHRIYKRL